jgi:hypothetical protein
VPRDTPGLGLLEPPDLGKQAMPEKVSEACAILL